MQIPESLLTLLHERRRLEDERETQEKLIPAFLLKNRIHIGAPTKRMARIDEEIGLINERIAHLRRGHKMAEKRDATKTAKSRKPEAMIWLGSKRTFGETILELFKKRLIRADTETDALRRASEHFVDMNGKPFKPRNTLQNVRNKQDFT